MALPGLSTLNTATPIIAQDRAGNLTGLVSTYLEQWLERLIRRVRASAEQLQPVIALTGQTAAIAVTPIPLGVLAAGRYRVAWLVRVTTPASVSSAVQVSIAWTAGGVALSKPGANLTGNTTTTYESEELPLIELDQASPISYSATYSSSGTPMAFALSVTVEKVS